MMAQIPEGLNQKIKNIRKSMQMSLHDCAKILGTTTTRYLAFEKGEESLSLPELEVMALYFGIPVIDCLQGQVNSSIRFSLLEEHKRTAYMQIREKWIRSRLILETENNDIKLDELSEALDIPIETLSRYRSGESSIPLNHLQSICTYFQLPLKDFFPELAVNELEKQQTIKQAAGQWNPEFPDNTQADQANEVLYNQLLAALKEMPEENQAQAAKALLEKLKSL
jgi:transcriptional regulator with XRE-family HTH domain